MDSELFLFQIGIAAGAFLAAAFDFTRALRKEIKHRKGCICLEDGLYWLFAGIFLFFLFEKYNRGVLRAYVFFGNGLGMVLYRKLLQKPVFGIFCLIFRWLCRGARMIGKIRRECGKILKKLIYYPLKCIVKKFKILLHNI